METLILNAECAAKLRAVPTEVMLLDEAGKLVGFFQRCGPPPPDVTVPFTEEELSEFRKQKDGKPLSEILARLDKL